MIGRQCQGNHFAQAKRAARKWHQERKVVRHGQIKPAHWIVRAANFIAIHKLFDDAASPVLDASGLMADSVVRSSGTADGTVQMASAKSYLVQYGLGVADEAKYIFAISAAMAAGWRACGC